MERGTPGRSSVQANHTPEFPGYSPPFPPAAARSAALQEILAAREKPDQQQCRGPQQFS